MRILVLNWKDRHHPAAGGAEVYTHEVAARLVRRGHDVTLFCAAVPGRPPVEVDEGITVVRAGSRLGVYAAARRFWARHPHRWDVVVDEVNTRPFLTPRWVRGTPVVALIHQVAAEVWDAELPRPVAILGRRVLEPRWLAAYATTPTMTVSASSAASLRTYGLGDLRLVPEGLSLPQGLPSARKEATLTLCCIGRLSASKRVDHALAAFADVRRRVPGARLWIVGDGPERARLERTAPAGASFLGRVDEEEKFRRMAGAHALLMTSVREGWGLVVDEAAAVGTPTIAYDRPGLRDSVTAADGWLTDPTPQALAREVLHRMPLLLAGRGGGWRGGATSWDVVTTAVEEVLSDAVAA